MAENKGQAPIIVKKIKKGGHGHHGGAWKVAYADFVTAMMAFFLLLWLLNVSTEEQLHGIADYFRPASVSDSTSGSGGVMGGLTMVEDGALESELQPMGIQTEMPGEGEFDEQDEGYPSQMQPNVDREYDAKKLSEAQLEEMKLKQEEMRFQQAEEALRAAISENPELAELSNNLIIDRTPEGLRIQIVDSQGRSMFPLGSADMHGFTGLLLGKVAEVIEKLPNRISIRGHTDSVPFAKGADYNNWDLSTDRANASRRGLIAGGLKSERIYNVVGKAAGDPLLPEDTTSPRNRRISIVLLKDKLVPATE